MSRIESGVYYAPSDYVGFIRRTLIDLVDGIVLLFLWFLCLTIVIALHPAPGTAETPVTFSLVAIAFAYLVILKRYAVTLGYAIFRSQVVNLQGNTPSLGALTLRAMFLFIGPFNTLSDLIWLTSDPDRQAIRDRFARTYVIRRDAKPVGSGHIRYMRLDMLGWNVLLPEVTRESHRAEDGKPVDTI